MMEGRGIAGCLEEKRTHDQASGQVTEASELISVVRVNAACPTPNGSAA